MFQFQSLGCIGKKVGSGRGAITESCLRPELAMGWIHCAIFGGEKKGNNKTPKIKNKNKTRGDHNGSN